MQFTLPEQSDWCDSMPIRVYNLRPSFTSERVQTLFFDKAAGCVWKIWCLGTRLMYKVYSLAYVIQETACAGSYAHVCC